MLPRPFSQPVIATPTGDFFYVIKEEMSKLQRPMIMRDNNGASSGRISAHPVPMITRGEIFMYALKPNFAENFSDPFFPTSTSSFAMRTLRPPGVCGVEALDIYITITMFAMAP